MIKCPNCHSSKTAIVKHKNSKSIVEYRYDEKEIKKHVRPRVCLECGIVFVAKKDCEAIKREMERADFHE